jgi:hypothetical protein
VIPYEGVGGWQVSGQGIVSKGDKKRAILSEEDSRLFNQLPMKRF